MNTSQSQTTLSERYKHSPLTSASSMRSLPSANSASDRALSGLSSIEQLTGKGQLFPGLNNFQMYRSQDSVLSSESSVSDRQQYLDADSMDECDAGDLEEIAGDQSIAVSEGDCEESKDSFHLNMTVRELIETERVYVKDLRDVVVGYMQKIHRAGIISKEYFHDLFGNIRAIFEFNRQFLSHLQKNFGNPVKVAQCFVEHHNDFIIYSDYCTNYPRSLKVLENLMKDAKFVSVLKREQMKLQHPLPLETYLFKPVQRILKYHLLLKSMQSDYLEDAPGRDVVDTAVERMVAIALYINEMKRRHERLMRTQELQNMISGTQRIDLGSYGDLVLEDVFRLTGLWGDRLVLLFCKAIVLTKKRKDGSLQMKLVIRTSNLMVIESVPREPLQFHIYQCDSPKLKYTLQAKTLEQKQIWCQEIKSLIMDNFHTNIPEHAKQIVLGRTSAESSSQHNDSKSPSTFARRIYKSMTPEMKAEQRERRRSTSAIPKQDELNDTLKPGAGDLSLDDDFAEADPETILSSDREETQEDTVIEDSCDVDDQRHSPVINRRSQSLDYLCAQAEMNSSAERIGDAVNRHSVVDSVESSESEADDVKSTSEFGCSVTSVNGEDSSSNIRVIPIRAHSFKQAMQMEPIELNIQHRKSTLEDVFEDTVSGAENCSQSSPGLRNPVVMRNSSRSSSSSSDQANKRLTKLFDDWDPSVLDSISNMHELFKSWPLFNDTSDLFSSGHFLPINSGKVPEFSSLNHPLFNTHSRSRFLSTEPITTYRNDMTTRQMSVPVAHRSSLNSRPTVNASSVLDRNQSIPSCYRVPIRIINSATPSVSTCHDVHVTVESTSPHCSDPVDMKKTDGLPVKVSYSEKQTTNDVKVLNNVPTDTVNTDCFPVKVLHNVPIDMVKTDCIPVKVSHNVPVDAVKSDCLPVKMSYSVPVDKEKSNSLPVKVLHNVPIDTAKTDCIPVKVSYNVPVDKEKVLHNVPVKVVYNIPVIIPRTSSPCNSVPIAVNTCNSSALKNKCDTLPCLTRLSESPVQLDQHVIPVRCIKSVSTQEQYVVLGNNKNNVGDEYNNSDKYDVELGHNDKYDVECDRSGKYDVDSIVERGRGDKCDVDSIVERDRGDKYDVDSIVECDRGDKYDVECDRGDKYADEHYRGEKYDVERDHGDKYDEARYHGDKYDDEHEHSELYDSNCHDCAYDDSDDDQLKKMLQEMTVNRQTIRETVQKINFKASRSIDGLDGCVPATDSHPARNTPTVPVGKSKLSGDLIKKRVHLFQGEIS